jgi:hypothetical protein
VKPIALDDGQVSLELAREEVQTALRRLDRLGSVTLEAAATYEIVKVGEIRLVFQDEWDQPCLLSLDPAGANLLRSLANGDIEQQSAPA